MSVLPMTEQRGNIDGMVAMVMVISDEVILHILSSKSYKPTNKKLHKVWTYAKSIKKKFFFLSVMKKVINQPFMI